MPTIIGILTFMRRKKIMISLVEHEKSFITPRPGHDKGEVIMAHKYYFLKKLKVQHEKTLVKESISVEEINSQTD